MIALYAAACALGGWAVAGGHEAVVLLAILAAAAAAWRRARGDLAEGRIGILPVLILAPSIAVAVPGHPAAAIPGFAAAAAAVLLAARARAALEATTSAGVKAAGEEAMGRQTLEALVDKEAGVRARLERAVELSRALRSVLGASGPEEALAALERAAVRLGLGSGAPRFRRDGENFEPTFEIPAGRADEVRALTSQARLAVIRAGRMERLREVGRTDWLTGLPNRRALDETLPVEERRAAALGLDLAYVMIDIDHFKRFNDTHGHAVGDTVLMTVARQLRHVARKSDFVARYGGEEFALILPESPVASAKLLAERVQKHLAENPARPRGHSTALPVTVSIGISSRGLAEADKALYLAKQSGRNRIEVA